MLWKESKQKDAQELITWLLASKPAANAWDMNRSVMIGLVELAYSTSDATMTDYLVMQILNRMYEQKQDSVGDFETHYTQIKREQAQAKRSGQADWTFYIPLELRLPTGTRQRSIRFLGRRIDLLPETSALRQLAPSSIVKRLRRHFVVDVPELRKIAGLEIEYRPSPFLQLHGTGTHIDAAWDDVEPVFSALRGFIEFSGSSLFHVGSGRNVSLPAMR